MENRSYTNRDIKSIRDQLINQAKELTSDWTDFNESDLGMVFIELMSGVADMLGFYLDKQAMENFLPTVKQRKNGKGILSIIGYKFGMTVPCTVDAQFSLSLPLEVSLDIPRYTQISTLATVGNRKVNYVTAEKYLVQPNETEFVIPLIQGDLMVSEVMVKDIPDDGKLFLLGDNVAQNSIKLSLDGEEWEEVEDVIIDDLPGRKFSVNETKDDVTYIMLHPNFKKFLPVDRSMKLKIEYVDSLGPDGVVAEDSLYKVESPILLSGQNIANIVKVNNKERSSGGAVRESLDLAKRRSVNKLYTMNTAVMLDDYKYLAETVPGIFRATAIDWSVENSKYVTVPYTVQVYLIPENQDLCSNYEIGQVKQLLDSRKTSSIIVECRNAEYKEVDISIEIHSKVADTKKAYIQAEVEKAINELFNKDKLEFGQGIKMSNIISAVESATSYIDYVDMLYPDKNIDLEAYEFPKLGTLEINVIK